jgi:hypothetical protein
MTLPMAVGYAIAIYTVTGALVRLSSGAWSQALVLSSAHPPPQQTALR